jgi:protein O-mannosyl-transferase
MPPPKANRTHLLLAGIILVTFLVYFPSLNNGFTNWDDPGQVLENTHIHELSLSNTARLFSNFYVGMYQPVTMQAYAFFYALGGGEARIFHLFSLLLHMANILLVFILVRNFSRKDAPALITAALFGLSPMQTESVAWVSAMSNLLFTLFFLGGMITYLRYVRKPGASGLFLTLLFFLLSLLSKPAAITFPVLLVFTDLYFRRKFTLRLLLEKLPFFLASLIVGLLILSAREEASHIIPISGRYGFIERLLFIAYGFSFYVSRLFAPVELSAFHPYPDTPLPPAYFLAPLIPLMIIFLLFRLKGELRRQVLAGIFFFIITIAIVLEIIPLGVQVVKERYVYLPGIGLYYAFAAILLYFFPRGRRVWIVPAVMLCFLVVFSLFTYQRSKTWESSLSLWNDVLESYPEASAALINRGNAWQEHEDFYSAISDYSLAIRYEPGAADAYMNRGLAYFRMGRSAEALNDFDHAVAMGMDDASTLNNRGLIKASLNDFGGALADFERAVALDPLLGEALVNRGLMLAAQGRFVEAAEAFTTAIELGGSSAKAYYWRGMVFLQQGLTTAACRDLKAARAMGWDIPEWPEACIP